MRSEVYGNSVLPVTEGRPITYSLLCGEAEASGTLGCEFYGIQIEMEGETSCRPGLSASRKAVCELLDKLVYGSVTPVALNDVVDDWLVSQT
ncbi:MAG: DUF6514 family protein [Oscillospiraceae bacterium]|nr:DUF6514 family protein [Oscillospiraceae bacterium]